MCTCINYCRSKAEELLGVVERLKIQVNTYMHIHCTYNSMYVYIHAYI